MSLDDEAEFRSSDRLTSATANQSNAVEHCRKKYWSSSVNQCVEDSHALSRFIGNTFQP